MEGAVRVFAGEYGGSTLSIQDSDTEKPAWVVTPSGTWCRLMLLSGALTEVTENGDMVHARIADPTGVFNLAIGGRNNALADTFHKLPVPSFVTVDGRAQMYLKNDRALLSVRPDHVQLVNRHVRDQWVLVTAKATLGRLHRMNLAIQGKETDERILAVVRHYSITKIRLRELALMAEGAIQTVCLVESEAAAQPDVRTLVMALVNAGSGPRGVAVEDIIEQAVVTGVSRESVLAAIESLIVDDECYQPQKGFIKQL